MQNVKDLKSYLGGQWVWGSGTPQNLYNPTTDEVVAQVNASGLDLRPALDFARKEGGSQLRAMTFAQRATLLESMSKTIHAKRDELIEIGRINAGNTRADAKFDIDGASQTLMYYANLGKTLEDFTLMTDGGAVENGEVAITYLGRLDDVAHHGTDEIHSELTALVGESNTLHS